MKKQLLGAILGSMLLLAPIAQGVTFDWATVDNAGNAPDPENGLGAVDYNFRIATTEVTNAQYAEFLNAVDPTGANELELFHPTDFNQPITDSGTIDGARYIVDSNYADAPVSNVHWFSAIRFINWMHNGQGSGDTESGAYTLLGRREIPSNVMTIERNPDARFWMPSIDEWYKSAYHDASSGVTDTYFDYANGSDTLPVSDQPEDNRAAANYFSDDGVDNGFNDGLVYPPANLRDKPFPMANVGAYFEAVSPYGTYEQTGNAAEFNDSYDADLFIVVQGGSYASDAAGLRAQDRALSIVGGRGGFGARSDDIGFRVATLAVPEPTALLLLAAAGTGLMLRLARRG